MLVHDPQENVQGFNEIKWIEEFKEKPIIVEIVYDFFLEHFKFEADHGGGAIYRISTEFDILIELEWEGKGSTLFLLTGVDAVKFLEVIERDLVIRAKEINAVLKLIKKHRKALDGVIKGPK